MRDIWFALPSLLMRGSAQVVTLGASPYVFTAPGNGAIAVSGGTASLIEYGRSGAYVGIGVLAGMIPVSKGDTVRVTYVTVPSMTFFPQ